ncbi:MAG: class I SAM-dependent methyltransferase [Planctomycetota bacterium]
MKHTAQDWIENRSVTWCAHHERLEAMLRPVNGPLMEALQLDAPYRIADVGCGAGDFSMQMQRFAPAGTTVEGFDVAPVMVETAAAQAEHEHIPVTFKVANVETWVPAEPMYHRLCSRFGVMFFENPERAFANLRRWMVPDGRFTFAVWAEPERNAWSSTIMDVVGSLIELPPDEPGSAGPFRYQNAAALLPILEGVGFRDIGCQNWVGELPMGGALSAEEAANFALSSFGIGQTLAEHGEAALEEGKRLLAKRFATSYRDGAVWKSASVHLISGRA